MKTPYQMLIQWSETDKRYVVFLPDFEGIVYQPCSRGRTFEEAARNGQQVLEILLEHLRESGHPLPSPRSYSPLQTA